MFLFCSKFFVSIKSPVQIFLKSASWKHGCRRSYRRPASRLCGLRRWRRNQRGRSERQSRGWAAVCFLMLLLWLQWLIRNKKQKSPRIPLSRGDAVKVLIRVKLDLLIFRIQDRRIWIRIKFWILTEKTHVDICVCVCVCVCVQQCYSGASTFSLQDNIQLSYPSQCGGGARSLWVLFVYYSGIKESTVPLCAALPQSSSCISSPQHHCDGQAAGGGKSKMQKGNRKKKERRKGKKGVIITRTERHENELFFKTKKGEQNL